MLDDADKQWLNERFEIAETKLLTAFHSWAHTHDKRARGTSTALALLDERLGLVEERIAKLERRNHV